MPSANTIGDVGTATLNAAAARSVAFWQAYGGITPAPWEGQAGVVYMAGGGHTDGPENDVYKFDNYTGLISRVKNSATIFVKPGTGPNPGYTGDYVSGWLYDNTDPASETVQVGELCTGHVGTKLIAAPASAISGAGAASTWLVQAGVGGIAVQGQRSCTSTFKLRAGVDQQWTQHSALSLPLFENYWTPLADSCYDPTRNRLMGHLTFGPSGGVPSTSLMYRNLTTGAVTKEDFTGIASHMGGTNAAHFYMAADDCLLIVGALDSDQSVPSLTVWDLVTKVCYRPTLTGTLPSMSFHGTQGWSNGWRKAFMATPGEPKRVYFLTPTGNVRTAPWACTYRDFAGADLRFGTADVASGLNRLYHVEALGALLMQFGVEGQPVQAIPLVPAP